MNTNPYLASVQKDLNLYKQEKVLVVGIKNVSDELFYYQLTEIKSLCEACGYLIEETITQNIDTPNSRTFIGSGKLQEIKAIIEMDNIEKVIFNAELTPAQIKNISEVLDNVEVIDRTMLILEIFEKRATSKEAILQVEIAKMKYLMPRLIGSRKYLSRTTSSASASNRGAGETQLELDRRHIQNKINQMEQELIELKKQRQTTRKLRQSNEVKTIAFVGYTNAGKSSTINAILNMFGEENLEKEVYVENMLFATLETQTRKIKLPNKHQFLITDTVGFVSNLPHHLVESFKSTLEEIKEASLIVHIVDASSPFKNLQYKTTQEVLSSLDILDIPTITVLNKCDLVSNSYFLGDFIGDIEISAKFKEGIRTLVNRIDEILFNDVYLDKLLIPFDKGGIVSMLKDKCEVLDLSYTVDGVIVTVKLDQKLHNMLSEYIIKQA